MLILLQQRALLPYCFRNEDSSLFRLIDVFNASRLGHKPGLKDPTPVIVLQLLQRRYYFCKRSFV